MQLNRFTLTFTGDQHGLETDFRARYFTRNLRTIRWSLIFGLCAYLGFGVLDRFVFPESFRSLWSLRFGFTCHWILATLAATWLPGFDRVWQPVLAVAVAVAGAMIVAMTVMAPPPFSYTYYAGVALVLVYGYTVSRLRFLWAAAAGWVIVCAYEIAAIRLISTPPEVLLSNNFFFISTNLLGMVASYTMEYHARRDHWLAHQLAEEKARVQASHFELSAKVEELEREREKVRVLRGLIPICSHCKRIRDDKGYWNRLESYLKKHSHAEFSHGICPQCLETHYSEFLK